MGTGDKTDGDAEKDEKSAEDSKTDDKKDGDAATEEKCAEEAQVQERPDGKEKHKETKAKGPKANALRGMSEKEVEEVQVEFKKWDRNKSGGINKSDLKFVLKLISSDISDDDVEVLMTE